MNKEKAETLLENYKALSELYSNIRNELKRTRKALEIAKDTIRHADWFFDGYYNVDAKTMHNEIKYAIKAITAPEQKERKDDKSSKSTSVGAK